MINLHLGHPQMRKLNKNHLPLYKELYRTFCGKHNNMKIKRTTLPTYSEQTSRMGKPSLTEKYCYLIWTLNTSESKS